ncbi:TonB-dependent receptor [Rhizorhabdus sp. FW153]|uniref:TonB-dependent receptor n=1 Tax=Rhizorhabdus sp. FW153 TaxID=3400216 RepID=UPI003CF673CB
MKGKTERIREETMLKTREILMASAGIVAVLASAPVFAQDTAAQSEAADANDGGIAEIIVTAQRRGESQQDVPIAIAAFSDDSLAKAGIRNSEDLGMVSPSLVFSNAYNGASPFMRGIGTKNTQPTSEPLVALYVDGFYYPSFESGLFNFSNIERIEILRGPQGTLFGRNVTAGLMQVITRDPSHDPMLNIQLGYGNYDAKTASLYGSVGVSEQLAGDVSVYYEKHDGWGRNLTTGEQAHFRDSIAARSKWLFETDTLRVTIAGDYSYQNSDIGASSYQRAGTVTANGSLPTASPYDTRRNLSAAVHYSRSWGLGMKVEHEMGWANLTSLTRYGKQHSYFTVDTDMLAIDGVGSPRINSRTNSFTQEIQLASAQGSSFTWVVGGFLQDGGGGPKPIIVGSNAGIAAGTPLFTGQFEAFTTSVALYAQATVPIADELNLTGGVRYSWDKQRLEASRDSAVAALNFPFTVKNKSWSQPTWRLAIDYQANDDLLLFASYNRGYRNGRFDLLSPTANPVEPETVDSFEIGFKSDLLDRHLRFNLNAFHTDYNNKQESAIFGGSPTPQLVNVAKARFIGVEGDITAIPVDNLTLTGGFTWMPTSKYVSYPGARPQLPLAAGGNSGTTTVDLSGMRTENSPKFVFTLGADYRIPTSIGEFNLNANYRHSSAFNLYFAGRVVQEPYGVLNARIGWTSTDERWGLSFWGKNITDTLYNIGQYVDTQGDFLIPAAPQTYGVTASMKF